MPFHLQTSHYSSELPGDKDLSNNSRQVPEAAYSYVKPVELKNAQIVHVSKEVADLLSIQPDDTRTESFLKMVSGQPTAMISETFAMNYGGHQFGHWAGQLGDGRAINIGQIPTEKGVFQLQLKGAGPTPYSRRGDGFAVLRSSIREHLCSEAMYHLGVPTTRSLSLVLSGEDVMRDMFYDGNQKDEPGAVVCRVAPSFVRFGNYQLAAANGNLKLLQQLTDYTIQHHFPEINTTGKQKYLDFFQQVADTTLDLMIHWQRVGFVHGVMNTDNMSILGITIDYGPYGWLEDYNANWTPNTTDNQHKRYAYGAQPEIALWNLWQLANALFPLVDDSAGLEAILDSYKTKFPKKHLDMMREKLGLQTAQDADADIVEKLMAVFPLHEVDMTLFYRELAHITHTTNTGQAFEIIQPAVYHPDQMPETVSDQWKNWLSLYIDRLGGESAFAKARLPLMQRTNPKFVLRNYMAQLAITDAETGDYTLLNELHELLKNPYGEQPSMQRWYAKRPEWARNSPGSWQLSCSS